MNTLFKKALPHIIAILSFVLVSVAFYSPAVSGKKLKMGDINQWKGMSKELVDYEAKNGEDAVWTNSMFSGMPAYQIYIANNGNIVKTLDKVYKLGLPRPIDILFKAMLGFYILLMCMRVKPVVGAIGAISFGLSSFFILYLGAGHASKMNAITYIAPMLGGILYAFRRHALKGAAIAAFFLCLHLAANHFQMTYYALFLVVLVGIGEVIRKIIAKETMELPKAIGFLVLAGILGVIPNYTTLTTTAEYGEYSTRGNSELSIKPKAEGLISTTEEGLGKDYILEYSMSHGEWMSAYIPNAKGGKTDLLVNVPEAKKELNKNSQQFLGQNQILSYWGEQRGTAGAFYFGALMFFLAICSIFLLKDSIKWPLLLVAIISVLASWKLGSVPDFFLENVPLWNKFRDTKMMLILLMLIIPLLGSLFLNQFLENEKYRELSKKFLLIIGGAFALFNIILISSPGTIFDFLGSAEKEAFARLNDSKEGKEMLSQIIKGRQGIFTADVTRSFIIFLLGFLTLALVTFKQKAAQYAAYAIGIVFIGDMWSVDHRYFDTKSSFQTASQNRVPFPSQNVEKQILSIEKGGISDFDSKVKTATDLYKTRTGDTRSSDSKKLQREIEVLNQNTNYRVLNIGNPWSDARTSYYHKSLGGYHGAKLKIYQELIDFHLGAEAKGVLDELQSKGRLENSYPMLSMLNTKYMIGNPEGDIIPFQNGLGNAWFISNVETVKDADAEMTALSNFRPDSTVVIQEKYAEGLKSSYSNHGSIELTDYKPNQLTYSVNKIDNGLAVFSEIYFPEGWNAYVDGELSSHLKVNYVLRGLELPAGSEEVIFKFEPQTYHTGRIISMIGSILLLLLCAGMLGKWATGLKSEITE